jgi:N-dimethylarginine dimethylaminohydrolase
LSANDQRFVESDPLTSALLLLPPAEHDVVDEPLYDRPIAPYGVTADLMVLHRRLHDSTDVAVRSVEVTPDVFRRHPNVHYLRDSMLATPLGVVVTRPALGSRHGEEAVVVDLLDQVGTPAAARIRPPDTLEGADCLWLRPDTLVCAVGGRTTDGGVAQLEELVAPLGVRCLRIAAPSGVRHLLGAVQLVDDDLALVRADLLPTSALNLMAALGLTVLRVPEGPGFTAAHGFNLLVVGPRRVVASADHPAIVAWLRARAGVEVVAEMSYATLAGAGGGIACATGVITRSR